MTIVATMHDTDAPQTDPTAPSQKATAGGDDELLDGFEEDLESVGAALDALDADDLDTAEALAEKLATDPDTLADGSDST
jgi:hypothetical protein